MADSLKKHESHDAATRQELGDLKIHVLALTQAVMGLLRGVAKPPPPQAPQMRQGAPQGAGGPPQIPPQLAAMIAAKRQQAMQQPQMPPQGPPPGAVPGHALGGLQMGLNRLEPTGAFSRGIAHSLNPTKLNFHTPHPGHFAMGGMMPAMGMQRPMPQPMARPPIVGRPAVNPGMLAAMASRYGVR